MISLNLKTEGNSKQTTDASKRLRVYIGTEIFRQFFLLYKNKVEFYNFTGEITQSSVSENRLFGKKKYCSKLLWSNPKVLSVRSPNI